jgi:hypothetical protein
MTTGADLGACDPLGTGGCDVDHMRTTVDRGCDHDASIRRRTARRYIVSGPSCSM